MHTVFLSHIYYFTCICVLQMKTAETRTVRQFHFTAWPDHGVPETTELLISFRHLVREHMDQYSRHSPTVVHCRSAANTHIHTLLHIDLYYCFTNYEKIEFKRLLLSVVPSHSPPSSVFLLSAGVGRTGTFIAIDRLIFQIERENIVDVYGIVHDLRMHRPLMVQTEVRHSLRFGHKNYTLYKNFCTQLNVSAGSVRLPKPMFNGHHQIKNWNQCGSNLPKHCCTLHLWKCRTQKRFPKKWIPQCIDPGNQLS